MTAKKVKEEVEAKVEEAVDEAEAALEEVEAKVKEEEPKVKEKVAEVEAEVEADVKAVKNYVWADFEEAGVTSPQVDGTIPGHHAYHWHAPDTPQEILNELGAIFLED